MTKSIIEIRTRNTSVEEFCLWLVIFHIFFEWMDGRKDLPVKFIKKKYKKKIKKFRILPQRKTKEKQNKQSYREEIWTQPNFGFIYISWNLFPFECEVCIYYSFQNHQSYLFTYYWVPPTYPKILKPPTPLLAEQVHDYHLAWRSWSSKPLFMICNSSYIVLHEMELQETVAFTTVITSCKFDS